MLFGNAADKIDGFVAKGKSQKVIPLLETKNKETRLRAIEALGKIADDHCVHALIPLLSDSDPEIRKQTAISMGDMKKDVCKTHLQNRVQIEKDHDVLDAIHDAIMRITKEVGLVK
ncbi:MAG: HEAT repeat domain-containing protein [Clostridiaceae bacterium]|nr:HEAT repeat domain-containing protein [Eubacteriales bacterium]NLV47823.1 HEAT repeat domain-containing protein [Clostridiaceae bacterium]